jgi:hypothetical protein
MFNDVKFQENRIGDGICFKFAMKTLAGGRIGIHHRLWVLLVGLMSCQKHTKKKELLY